MKIYFNGYFFEGGHKEILQIRLGKIAPFS